MKKLVDLLICRPCHSLDVGKEDIAILDSDAAAFPTVDRIVGRCPVARCYTAPGIACIVADSVVCCRIIIWYAGRQVDIDASDKVLSIR